MAGTAIAADTAGVNGCNGLIILDSYASPLALANLSLGNVFKYLQANLGQGMSLAFVAGGNSYVFQDGGDTDTAVQITSVAVASLNTDGFGMGGVWLV